MFSHDIQECQRTGDIVVIVFPRLVHGFADCLEAREMDDCVRLLRVKYTVQCFPVPDVRFIERNFLSGNGLDSADDLRACVVQVVQYDRFMPRVLQLDHGMASDKACTTSHQNCLFHICSL